MCDRPGCGLSSPAGVKMCSTWVAVNVPWKHIKTKEEREADAHAFFRMKKAERRAGRKK